MRIKRGWKQLAVIVLLTVFSYRMQALAAEGNAHFGSESYLWNVDENSPIGVYFKSDTAIRSYEIHIEYDSTMLEYLDGAEERNENILYVRGGGTTITYSHMLHFRPLKPGNTSLRVISASAWTIADESGRSTQIEIPVLSEAPIEISAPFSTKLSDIRVNGETIENFSPDNSDYELQVDSDTEQLIVAYETESAQALVTVSDTALLPGDNTITICVINGEAEQEYRLYVKRKEEPVITQQPETVAPDLIEIPVSEEKENDTTNEIMKEPETALSPILLLAILGTIILTLLYALQMIRNAKKEKVHRGIKKENEEFQVINLDQTVISVDRVTMRFRQAKDEASSLKEYLIRAIKHQNHYQYFTALEDISFEVKQGDVVGIIGTNGSGKSTLLKIISGALRPTEGTVTTDRKKIQMLTLGTGFDMELTAKENVYLNGAIIGYTKEYIAEKYDAIVDFAELNGFMEERMKNFSSGMISRLGFAIATMRDTPEILILDEVLAVGDMFFRQKSEKRIQEMIHSGATVLIVSHSMDVISKNCNKVIWIEKGVLQMIGEPKAVCDAYKKSGH